MALSAATQWDCRTGGLDTNGGGFVAGASGTDWSQQSAPQYSVTNGVTNGTTTITSATAAFGTDVVGNIIYVQGGTGAVVAGWYQIITRTSATAIVVDRSTGLTSGTGVTLRIGGALLTVGKAFAVAIAENIVWAQGPGTFAITVGLTMFGGAATPGLAPSVLAGYQTVHGDTPTGTNRPLVSTASAIVMLTMANGNQQAWNMEFDGGDAATTGINVFSSSPERGCALSNVTVRRCATTGISMGTTQGILCQRSEVTDMKAAATQAWFVGPLSVLEDCVASDNPCPGFSYSGGNNGAMFLRCIADSNTGASSDGFSLDNCLQTTVLNGCVAYGNGRDGLRVAGSYAAVFWRNCIFEGNTGFGVRMAAGMRRIATPMEDYNAYYSNTAGARSVAIAGAHDVTLTSSAFTDAPNKDFSLNNTAGGGAACRGAGYPGTFTGL